MALDPHVRQAPSFVKPTWISKGQIVRCDLEGPTGKRYRQSCIVRQANDRVVAVGDIAKQHIEVVRRSLNIAVVQTSRKLFPKKK